jgi:hypothetical protein
MRSNLDDKLDGIWFRLNRLNTENDTFGVIFDPALDLHFSGNGVKIDYTWKEW